MPSTVCVTCGSVLSIASSAYVFFPVVRFSEKFLGIVITARTSVAFSASRAWVLFLKISTLKIVVSLNAEIMFEVNGVLSESTIPMFAVKGTSLPKIAVKSRSIITGNAMVQKTVSFSLKNVLMSFMAIPIIGLISTPPLVFFLLIL